MDQFLNKNVEGDIFVEPLIVQELEYEIDSEPQLDENHPQMNGASLHCALQTKHLLNQHYPEK